ncbi:TraY domain-containing protein [Buttiauxella ferragutiae]|uniref:TraY domain-containing protein n=1 Tax=Buttiauxella ferragutiae TaxID=82989 RepID=UPI0035259981
MKRYSSSPALGNTVRFKLDSVTDDLLNKAVERSGRSLGFEVFYRVKDHLNRFPMFTVMDKPELTNNYVTVRFDSETNLKLINAKNRSGWCKTYEVRERLHDHLSKFPDFYNAEMVEVIPNNLESKSHN